MHPESQLLRQIHPNHFQEGRVLSVAFRPSKKDEGKLSVCDGELCSAKDAFEYHTVQLGLGSGGTWGVTVNEVTARKLPIEPDPLLERPNPKGGMFPEQKAHALINFNGLPPKEQGVASSLLAHSATQRGRLHPNSHGDVIALS
ncbi:MAG TPA: hypothetical protein PLN52_22715 [Opitutaceae bacterium]|nr:hypothetical protein [Opitutaceae bacterium]